MSGRPSSSLREVSLSLCASVLLAGLAFAAGAGPLPATLVVSTSCWVLVAAGVLGTFLASRGVSWGWLLLVGLQPLWISYAIATGQYGFILGALAYGGAQLNGFVRTRRR